MLIRKYKKGRNVFISYSHDDGVWLDELLKSFGDLKDEVLTEPWHDGRIKAGQIWEDEIKKAISHSRVAILIVTSNFLASEYIKKREIPFLKRAWWWGRLDIIPIIADECNLKNSKSLRRFQMINEPDHPLSELDIDQREVVYTQLKNRIAAILKGENPLSERVNTVLRRFRVSIILMLLIVSYSVFEFSIHPYMWRWYFVRGLTADQSYDTAKAEKLYRKSEELCKRKGDICLEPRNNLGRLLINSGRYSVALSYYDQILRDYPVLDDKETYAINKNIGWGLVSTGDYSTAIPAINNARAAAGRILESMEAENKGTTNSFIVGPYENGRIALGCLLIKAWFYSGVQVKDMKKDVINECRFYFVSNGALPEEKSWNTEARVLMRISPEL